MPQPASSPVLPPLLRLRDLSVSFETPGGLVNILNRVSFEVQEGEIVGLLGESGAGKSVLADAILGLLPTPPAHISGEVLYRGRDLRRLPEEALSAIRGNELAMIFQDPTSALNPVFRVGLQVAEPLELHQRLPRRVALGRVVDFFRRVGIPSAESRVQNYPHQFSGGMRQRVVISMAMTCRPKVLIADEPTSSLDVTIQAQILELIRSLVQELQAGVLFIFNDLALVSHMCHRLLILYAGQIVEAGPVDAVLASPSHPYTRGLLGSVPRLGVRRLQPIPGQLSAPAEYVTGCRFHPRCPLPQKDAHCAAIPPPLEVLAPGQAVACWKVER